MVLRRQSAGTVDRPIQADSRALYSRTPEFSNFAIRWLWRGLCSSELWFDNSRVNCDRYEPTARLGFASEIHTAGLLGYMPRGQHENPDATHQAGFFHAKFS